MGPGDPAAVAAAAWTGTEQFGPQRGDPPTLEETKAAIEKRLFIGRVPLATNEEELRSLFGAYGTLNECRIMLDKGVAFVGYETWAAAHKALLATDGQACLAGSGGMPLSVQFAERSGAPKGASTQFAKGLEHNRIFVGSLPESVTDLDVKQLFEVFGEVKAANLLAAKGNRRCGFVNFSLWGEALDAMEMLDGQKYPGTYGEAMTVVLASPREGGNVAKKFRADVPPPLPPVAAAAAAASAVPALGDLVTAAAGATLPDPEYESLKVAYLAAVDGDTPSTVCDELHRKIMASRPAAQRERALSLASLQAAVAAPLAAATAATAALPIVAAPPAVPNALVVQDTLKERDAARLFVGGLPYQCNDEELRALVDQVTFTVSPEQHELLECRVLPGKGCGYVRFSSWEAAEEAIQCLNERSVSGWPMPLRVRWATPKSEMGNPNAGLAALSNSIAAQQSLQQSQAQAQLTQLLGQELSLGAELQDPALAATFSSALQSLLGVADPTPALAQLTGAAAVPALNSAAVALTGLLPDEAAIAAQGLDPKRLFVGQLTRELKDKALLSQVFEPFGHIETLRWLEDKGVAYVQYTEYAAAAAAKAALEGKHVPGVSRDLGLNISFSRVR